jgi:hypothetical protein
MGRIDELLKVVGQAAPEPKYIRAYHGSPHDFDRFDASKIGTGEGAQSYGHGLYFAGNEKVAIDYRDRLKDLVDGPVPDELGDELQGVIHEIRNLSARKAAASGDEYKTLQALIDDAFTRHADVQHRIREASYNPGRMYEVEIGFPEDSLLDWDASLSRQPEAVQRAFAKSGGSFSGMTGQAGDGQRLWLNRRMGKTEADASRELLEAGVPGIKYFDAVSRRTGSGTRNYVMFPGTEDSIRILRKYGLLAPIAAGAAMQGQE